MWDGEIGFQVIVPRSCHGNCINTKVFTNDLTQILRGKPTPTQMVPVQNTRRVFRYGVSRVAPDDPATRAHPRLRSLTPPARDASPGLPRPRDLGSSVMDAIEKASRRTRTRRGPIQPKGRPQGRGSGRGAVGPGAVSRPSAGSRFDQPDQDSSFRGRERGPSAGRGAAGARRQQARALGRLPGGSRTPERRPGRTRR